MGILRGKFQVLRKFEPEERAIGFLFIGKQFVNKSVINYIRFVLVLIELIIDLTVNKRDRI